MAELVRNAWNEIITELKGWRDFTTVVKLAQIQLSILSKNRTKII
jgi:hypothetical protein